MSNQFTPGPWQEDDCVDANGHITIRRADQTPHGNTEDQPIATVYEETNARLIAAAPALYKAIGALFHASMCLPTNAFKQKYEQECWAKAMELASAALALVEAASPKGESAPPKCAECGLFKTAHGKGIAGQRFINHTFKVGEAAQ